MSQSMKLMAAGAVFALAAAGSAAIAQPPGAQGYGRGPGGPGPSAQISVFSRAGFNGPAGVYNGPVDRLPSGVAFGSAQLRGSWQICSGVNFTGDCRTTDRDIASYNQLTQMGLRAVGSFRPAGNPGPFPPGPPAPPPPERGDNPNLRGNSVAFYPRPAERGFRIELDTARGRGGATVTPSYREIQDEAGRFCRTNGLPRVVNAGSEEVNRRFYLADVVCGR